MGYKPACLQSALAVIRSNDLCLLIGITRCSSFLNLTAKQNQAASKANSTMLRSFLEKSIPTRITFFPAWTYESWYPFFPDLIQGLFTVSQNFNYFEFHHIYGLICFQYQVGPAMAGAFLRMKIKSKGSQKCVYD